MPTKIENIRLLLSNLVKSNFISQFVGQFLYGYLLTEMKLANDLNQNNLAILLNEINPDNFAKLNSPISLWFSGDFKNHYLDLMARAQIAEISAQDRDKILYIISKIDERLSPEN
jgi:hypothetical protein